jgi:hypothetical protein
MLFWQLSSAPPARHLRYQREVVLPLRVSGQVCVALGGTVFAHTASAGAGDIRIYGREGSDRNSEFEVPFALTESGPVTAETQAATVGNVAVRDGALVFDLAMPSGDYTEVDLELNVKDFVGAAQVAGVDAQGHPTPLRCG